MSTESPQKHLYLFVDAMGMLFRAFHGTSHSRVRLTAPDGTPTGALHVFFRMFFKLVKGVNPTHVVVAWDAREKTFRHEMDPKYKANRQEPDPDILVQIPIAQELVEKMGFHTLIRPGWEADDIIGTLVEKCRGKGEAIIASSDKDLKQLVESHARYARIAKNDEYEILGPKEVEDEYGIPPEKLIHMFALVGDSSDNVEGIKGIGESKAAALVAAFGDLEGVLSASPKALEALVNPRGRKVLNKNDLESLKTGADVARLALRLVTIARHVPLDFVEKEFQYSPNDLPERAKNAFDRLDALGMKSLLKELSGADKGSSKQLFEDAPPPDLGAHPLKADPASGRVWSPVSTAQQTGWGDRRYQTILTKTAFDSLLERIKSCALFAFDTETTGLDMLQDTPIGFSVSFEKGEGFYVPLHAQYRGEGVLLGGIQSELDPKAGWADLGQALGERQGMLVAHNLKFDAHMCRNVGVDLLSKPYACSMIAAWMVEPGFGGYGLDPQSLKRFGLVKIPTEALIGKKTGRKSMLDVPLSELGEYAAEDVDATLRIWQAVSHEMEDMGVKGLFFEMEMPLLSVLLDMERTGVHVDAARLGALAMELQEKITDIEREVWGYPFGEGKEVGVFNLGSPRQLGEILFGVVKVQGEGYKGKIRQTTLGYATDAGTLETFTEAPFPHTELVKKILLWREFSKLLNTYVLTLPKLIKPLTHRVHTSFMQIGTATGRLSSNDPNLQNIPVQSEWGRKIRAAFTAAEPNSCIISVDYSQVELRVMAAMAKDKNMKEAFEKGADIHRETAARILGKSPSEITREERSNAKAINFGIIYGMGARSLGLQQGISQEAATRFIQKYFLTYPSIEAYIADQRQKARDLGFVSTWFGRPRPIPGIHSPSPLERSQAANMAINSPIQGTAADVMKLGMIRVAKALREGGYRTKLMLQVHDELVLEAPLDEKEAVFSLLKDSLEHAAELGVKLVAEVGAGSSWLEAK